MDAEGIADGFIVFDTHTGNIWNAGTKIVWRQRPAAKNAWNSKHYGELPFNSQKRYVVRPVRFIDMETGHYFT